MNRTVLIALVAVFALPLLAAKVVLEQGWFHGGRTNHGELLSPAMPSGERADGKWHIAYLLPAQCQQRCRNALLTLRQGYLALGRDQQRVESWLWVDDQSDPQILARPLPSEVRLRSLPDANWPVSLGREGTLFLVDPGGYLVLAYPLTGDRQADLQIGKGLLRDLRRLLKYS